MLGIFISTLLLIGAWEFWAPRRGQDASVLRRRFANIGFWLANLVLAAFLLGSPAESRRALDLVLFGKLPSWPIAEASLSFLAGFLLQDFVRYTVHRCEHAVPILWRFHALHHSDPDLDVTTSVRHHPIEYVLASVVYWLAIVILDIPVVVVGAYALSVFAVAAIQHGNIRLPEVAERLLKSVLVTTDSHRIHHSVEFGDANSNYGAVFSIWDRLFGTFKTMTRSEQDNIVFGVREFPRNECIRAFNMLLTPWLITRRNLVP